MIYLRLFLSFLQVGLFSVGGGYAAIPLIQSQAVERFHWLTMSQFTDLVTIAEMTPGPIAVNAATFVGIQIAGLPGAIAATAGCIFPACLLVSLLAGLYSRHKDGPAANLLLGSLRPAVVALIAAAGLSILVSVLFADERLSPQTLRLTGAALFLGAFFLLRRFRWNPILVMCLCGAANVVLHFVLR